MSEQEPRSIDGSIGSRIRIILGDTGSEYLVLLNEDNGNQKWQTKSWNNIPVAVAKQINNCTAKSRIIKHIDFGPTGAWYVNGIRLDGSGNHCWWNDTENGDSIRETTREETRVTFGSTDDDGEETFVSIAGRNGYSFSNVRHDLSSRIKRIHARRKKINFVRLFADSGYYISDDESEWYNVGSHCSNDLEERESSDVCDVAVAGDGSWVVIGEHNYTSSTGVSSSLTKLLSRFYKQQRERQINRKEEIKHFHATQRLIRMVQESIEQNLLKRKKERERRERERLEQERRERERLEQERLEQELLEQEHLEQERLEQELLEREIAAAREAQDRTNELELMKEAKSIEELEKLVNNRKRALQTSLSTLPPTRRARISVQTTTKMLVECVVCRDKEARLAVVPCGHQCLCDNCATQLLVSPEPNCPLCRGHIQRTLKIFTHG
eukprot:CAMPEP_0118683402 /NCGR_PEP_ID=MMETSP0800-20121206/6026_1 /TAXON_ID=210618 ORGANISM="Striatella unipunctata, Strain CCMP2910" /NCGR_SAMPLE_ID=MMETSP0800 /ASSEMBLY_ACC=CAM_ASM_000638 /LENGTH=439 /DNA_ID=CAMNT_0006579909 /DNA_START=96 /DNA_END=1415 /DNA_ORIENTATION=-